MMARRRAADHYRRFRPVLAPLSEGLRSLDRPDMTAEAHAAVAAIHPMPEAYRETAVCVGHGPSTKPASTPWWSSTSRTPRRISLAVRCRRALRSEPRLTVAGGSRVTRCSPRMGHGIACRWTQARRTPGHVRRRAGRLRGRRRFRRLRACAPRRTNRPVSDAARVLVAARRGGAPRYCIRAYTDVR
jgi:hypothetical protein